MIILCLGLPSSASTWAFNIVRALLAPKNPDMLGVFAETAEAFQQAVPPGTRDVILKAHTLDDVLFRAIEASDSPAIITWRDPRDAAVSMTQRTGIDVRSSATDIQRSAACVLSLMQLKRKNHLTLDYADDFMNRIETIRDIAKCLKVPAPPALVDRLFKSLKTDSLRNSLSGWSKSLGAEATFNSHVDMKTHWHKDHIGDGKSDKWKDIATTDAEMLDVCLGGYAAAFNGDDPDIKLLWDRLAWGVYEYRQVEHFDPIKSHTRMAPIHLPRGWWQAEFEVTTLPAASDRIFEISLTGGDKVLARRLIIASKKAQPLKLTFEHLHPNLALFLKCSGVDGVDEMPVSIPIARLRQMSSLLDIEAGRLAQRVSKEVLPTQ
jgi:hypothetical protein